MGAIFSLLPVLPYFALRRERENCISGCAVCTKKCPSDIGLPELGAIETRGDCFMCQKCTGICPKGNIHYGVSGKLKGNELWFTAIRAVFLLFLYLWIGI
jgi:polyferredoxin